MAQERSRANLTSARPGTPAAPIDRTDAFLLPEAQGDAILLDQCDALERDRPKAGPQTTRRARRGAGYSRGVPARLQPRGLLYTRPLGDVYARGARAGGIVKPLELLERLAAMTPLPETNLLICHGLLARRACWRERVVVCGRVAPEPTTLTPLLAGAAGTTPKSSARAWTWAALAHREFAIDVLACPHLWGPAAPDRRATRSRRKLLAHLEIARSGPSPGLPLPASC